MYGVVKIANRLVDRAPESTLCSLTRIRTRVQSARARPSRLLSTTTTSKGNFGFKRAQTIRQRIVGSQRRHDHRYQGIRQV